MHYIIYVLIELKIQKGKEMPETCTYIMAYDLNSVNLLQVGTIAGNLSIKHEHPEFPSDIFLLLATVGATLTIGELGAF
jgi:hypothetical protein